MTDHLPNQSQTAPLVMQPEFSGAILGLQGDVLHGWAMDNAQPEHRPIVEVLIDGASVALVRAEQYEPNAPVGDLSHGFAVQLRQRWLDGARLITAQIANQPFILQGQVALPTTPSDDSAAVASQVWHTGGLRIGGWCWDPKAPNRHVEVTVRNGDQIVGRALCDQHNQALAYRASSDHGFAIDLPWSLADGKVYELEIVNDLGRPLAGSPIRLCCSPEGIEGLIKQLSALYDEPLLGVIEAVAKEQSLRLPNSAGWYLYPAWADAFQRPRTTLESAAREFGVLLIGEGDLALEARSLSSFDSPGNTPLQLVKAQANDLGPALKTLLNEGCSYIVPLWAGDRLRADALAQFSLLLTEGTTWGYADCDQDLPDGTRGHPWFKPVWDLDFFIGADIFTHGSVFHKDIIAQAVRLLEKCGQQSLDWHLLMSAVILATKDAQGDVAHLPQVLYHRHAHTAISPEREIPHQSRLEAIRWLCQTLAPGTQVAPLPAYPSLLRAVWPLPTRLPTVSLVIPTKDQLALLRICIEGLLNRTDYPDLEIIVVDNLSVLPETLEYLDELPSRGVKVITHPYPFNYSEINNTAVRHASGQIIGLVNNDIEIVEEGWLKEMVSQLLRPGVGIVGAKLLWPNRMVQHGGVVVGINGLAAHVGNQLSEDDAGYLATNQLTRQQSAVTAACLLVHASVFQTLGGLDEVRYPVAFNDVDFCMRVRALGLKIIWCANARLIHAESASRGKDLSPEKRARAQREQMHFTERWFSKGEQDPFYHPALSHDYLSGPYGGLALPPRLPQVRFDTENRNSTADSRWAENSEYQGDSLAPD
ncbi:Glycosyl transferase family 2 [Pseudomonas sp. URMO17WK12:I11]|uniref:glycosyltransferase family 2 protein n=1 Tax=Pseudomonas sp. URMO17WK12:I11 TaxID=1283291 RepID=UPI0007223D86|nr:glycosyltransferase [Pseudomonas sp. URMO17WK12:I11]CRN04904.1 Glycosyl transferase family 2 [Pseudomonas sp. URMO17WK12:I11]